MFAENGIWRVDGVDGVFRATEYSVQRVSEVGIQSASSFVEADGLPFWWSREGIHTMTIENGVNAREQNLSISTVQSYWDAIPEAQKLTVRSHTTGSTSVFTGLGKPPGRPLQQN